MTEAQVFSRQWAPPAGVLGRIVAEAAARVAALDDVERRSIRRAAEAAERAPSFGHALTTGYVAVIAEVKRRSPSMGVIRESISSPAQGTAFERGGAAAISVLTEPAHFGGSLADLENTRAHVSIPLLRKDFHIDEIQLYQARASGASAALLIVRALSPLRLSELMSQALELDLEPLVEVRTEAELSLALKLGARVVGVNSRDLESLEVDPRVHERLLPAIPSSVIAIAESGIETAGDVTDRGRWGADAVLVGSILSRAADPESAVRALTGIRRTPRAR